MSILIFYNLNDTLRIKFFLLCVSKYYLSLCRSAPSSESGSDGGGCEGGGGGGGRVSGGGVSLPFSETSAFSC